MAANNTVYQVSTGSDTESEPDYHSDYDSDTQEWPDPEHEKLIEDFETHLRREQQMAVDLAAAIDRLFKADSKWQPTPENTKQWGDGPHHSTCPEQASNLVWILYNKIELPVLQTLIRMSFTKWAKKWTKLLISAYQRRKLGETELNPRRVKQYLRDIMEAPTPNQEPKPAKRKQEPKPAKRKREESTPTKRKRAKIPTDILQAHENHPETQDMPDWAVRVYVARKTAHYKQMNAVFPHLAKKL